MSSIAQLVEDQVLRQPFLSDALQRGIVNYGAVAEELMPKVQQHTKRLVRHAAVMMALRRFAEKLEGREPKMPHFEQTEIMIRSNLFELTVKNTTKAFEIIHDYRTNVKHDQGELLTVTQGLHELTIISNKQHLKAFKHLLNKEGIKNITEDLSLVTIKIPQDALGTPGYFYALTKAFAWENVNIIEIVSTLTEMTFALHDHDVPRAYTIVKNVLSYHDA
ncbi:hypothetical protein GOV07_05085 [Candidatus Woesearchaeota archaeon]|nr:hypothetical protein [Candidatus Woesearchaeota archaeon]